ncbi:hypothetical protein PIB30_038949 [Stylosanthes scabra]|uniref:Uncharacterized protein n=1 Tax=Stylosanthes scabra TaxID=79078 RepID=A0ABU6UCU4_9FABA|nr:hypothetical protein [Stylosanthes scabra]
MQKAIGRSVIWRIDFRRLVRKIDWSTELFGSARTAIAAKVSQVGGSSGFRPFVSPMVPSLINFAAPDDVAMGDYNSTGDSSYEEESSCHSTEEDEAVPNTPTVGGPRLVLPSPLLIPDLDEGGLKDRWSPYLFSLRDGRGSLLARQHVDEKCSFALGQDESIDVGSIIAECCPTELSFQAVI